MSIAGWIRTKLARTEKPAIGKMTARGWGGGQVLGAGMYSMSSAYMDFVLRNLRPPDYLGTVDVETMLKDEVTKDCVAANRAILLTSDYYYESDAHDQQLFVNKWIEEKRREVLMPAGWAFAYGKVPCETVWELRSDVLEGEGEAWWASGLRDLEPSEVGVYTDQKGDLSHLVFRGIRIPKNRACLFLHDDRFGRLQGESALLSSWRPWKGKLHIFDQLAIYCGQKANPQTVGFAPDVTEWNNATGDDIDRNSPMTPQRRTAQILSHGRSGAVMVLPSTRGQPSGAQFDTYPLFDVKLLETRERTSEFTTALQWCDLKIMQGLLATPGDGQASEKQGARMMFIKSSLMREEACDQMYKQIIRPMVMHTFGEKKFREGRLRPGLVAENKRELLLELARLWKDATQQLEKKWVKFSDMPNLYQLLEDLGVARNPLEKITRDEDPMAKEMALTPGRPRAEPGNKPYESKDPEAPKRAQ